jgi:hypothetical protein
MIQSINAISCYSVISWDKPLSGRHRVQLVEELLLALLVKGSNPSGVGLLLESAVKGWDPTCPIRVHFSIDTGNHTANKVCISNVL